jgi:type IV pilus assembly protein PilM
MKKLSIKKTPFLFDRNQTFGLDFNDSALRLIQIDKDKKHHRINAWSEKKFPSGVMQNFEIKNEEQFQEVFMNTFKESHGRIKGLNAVISIPENKIFTRVINIPRMESSEAAEAIKWETESNIPISVEETYFDWQIISKGEKNMEVLIVASPRKIIDNYLKTLDKIGVNVVACEAESIAIGRSVINSKNKDYVLVVNMGSSSTSFAIYRGTMPIFTSSSSVSGNLLTDAAAKHFGFSYEKAESYKIKTGLGLEEKEREESLKIFEPTLANLINEIEKTINFFNNNLNSNNEINIENIIICGGGSNLKGLDNYLSINLGKTINCSNPWENVNLKNHLEEMSKERVQSFTTAIGLALR